MLYLKTGVDLEKVEASIRREDELDRAGVLIANRFAARDGRSAHLVSKHLVQRRRRRLLDDLLVPALDRTLSLVEMNQIAVAVAEDLDLDVARPRDVALEEHAIVAEPARGFALRRGHGFTDQRYRVLYLVIDPGRDELRERIAARCDAMLAGGLLQEVRDLREREFGPELPCMQAIGYRHMEAVIQGLDTLRNVAEAMRRDTLRFARRQRTWFRAVPDAQWVHPDDEVGLRKTVEQFLGA